MSYQITTNVEILKRLIECHISQSSEDYSSAVKATDKIAEFINESENKIRRLRQFIGGELTMMDEEIDRIYQD